MIKLEPITFTIKEIKDAQESIFIRTSTIVNECDGLDYSHKKVFKMYSENVNCELLTIAKWYPIDGEKDTYYRKLGDVRYLFKKKPEILSGVLVYRGRSCSLCEIHWAGCMDCPSSNLFLEREYKEKYFTGCMGQSGYTSEEIYMILLDKLNITIKE